MQNIKPIEKKLLIVLALIFVITLSAWNKAKENKGDNSVVNSTVSQKDDDTKTDINDSSDSDIPSEENSSKDSTRSIRSLSLFPSAARESRLIAVGSKPSLNIETE